MRIQYLIIIISLFSSLTYGQVSTDEYLMGASQNPDVLNYQEQLEYLNDKPYKLSPVRRVQFRTENDELAEEQQEYAMRINPSNPWLVKRNNNLFQSTELLLNLEAQIAYKKDLVRRYGDIVNFCFRKKEAEVDSQLLEYLKQEHTVLITLAADRDFNTDRLIDVKIESLEQLMELENSQTELLNIDRKIKNILTNDMPINWKYKDLISPDSMLNVISQLNSKQKQSTDLELQQQKIDLIKDEIAIEKSIDNIGFIQTDYFPWRTSKNNFGVSLGITLPLFNPNKADVAERNLELIEEQNDLEVDKDELLLEKQNALDNFNATFARYKTFRNEINVLLSQGALDAYLKQKDKDPLKILKIRSTKTKLESKLLKYELELFLQYIQILAVHDVIQELPFKNYLSAN